MKAFAAGLTALTGVEAIANGVPLFREPRQLRAKRTEWLLGAILACMLLGIALLTVRFGALPTNSQSLLSRVMADAVGRNWAYYSVSVTIMVVLGLAANTSFGGLPVLFSLLARDGYAPRSFAIRGDRLVFERGIFVLAIAAAALLVAVNGNTQALIPMYAIGVFTGFTLSQAGMVLHWRKVRPSGWKFRATLNSVGAIATGISTILFVTTKFAQGAWVVVLTIPLLMIGFVQVHRYYNRVGVELKIGRIPAALSPRPRPIVIVPITPSLTELTRRALDHALSLSDQVLAVVVVFEGDESDKEMATFRSAWDQWNPPVRLVELKSQYHSVVRPLLRFIQTVDRRSKQRVLVLIPEIVPDTWGQELLHNRMGQAISAALRQRTDVMIGTVPMHLTETGDDANRPATKRPNA
jgi:hypothetical protein